MMARIIEEYLSYYENLDSSTYYAPMIETDDTICLKELSTVDFTPKIRFDDEFCYITWYEIKYFEGIYRRTYQIKKESPFSIILKEEEELLVFRRNFIW